MWPPPKKPEPKPERDDSPRPRPPYVEIKPQLIDIIARCYPGGTVATGGDDGP